eukprot:11736539-Heterocapsa_arctica.AAC.1
MEEAKRAIEEKLYFGAHDMESPRTTSAKNFRISAARVLNPDPKERAGFKFFMRGDIRDTAAYFDNMNFMEPIQG